MEELLKKYIHDNITPDELSALKTELKKIPDSELEKVLSHMWENHEYPAFSIKDENKIQQLKNSIIVQASKHRHNNIFKFIAAAAVFTIIVTVGLYIVLSTRYNVGNEAINPVMVQTTSGERATTYLPDGTSVALNYNSRLVWEENSFNRTSRNVTFEGEGFFNVKKNADMPFEIKSGQLTVVVTGTQFNLRWRTGKKIAQLYLINGNVELKSDITGEHVSVKPGQLARFDSETGKIECHDEPEDGLDQTRWRENELVFNKAPLNQVIAELSGCYGTEIVTATDINTKTPFTGTLPGGDLLEAMHTLEVTFGLVARLHGGTVELVPM